jgi:hypothetical protein
MTTRSLLRPTIPIVVLGVLLASAQHASAQDSQYWTLQYGTRGELLGGVVVGSAVDLSATYYNPGSLALVKDPSVILTATVMGMQTIRVKDEDPNQDAISSRNIGPEPSMFAGLLPMKWGGGRMAYSLLTRQKLDFRLVENEGAVIGLDEPGDSLSIGGEILLDENVGETWGGVTWSKRMHDHVGVGATLYGVYRSEELSRRQTVEAISNGGFGASLTDWNDVNYSTFRVLTKLGIETDMGGASLGLALTTAGLPIYGSGDILINRVLIGDTNLDGVDDSHATVSYGRGQHAEYRSPFSIALGGSYDWTTTTLHATVEYFTSVDPYTVTEAPASAGGPGLTTVSSRYDHALDSVVNFGAGIERRFSEKSTAYVSFILDHSAYARVPTGTFPIAVSTWDIYHLNGGVAFTIGGTDVTLGGGFAWGSQPLDVTPDSEGILPATVKPSEVTYSRVKVILGLAL